MLRDKFPSTKEEAKQFDVEIRDALGVFKIFDYNKSIENTVIDVNLFLLKNGYEEIPIDDFITNENSYESENGIVSLSPHGYKEALVLFIENENEMIKMYSNVDPDVKTLLIDFFNQLKSKAIGYEPARYLHETIEGLKNFLSIPKRNVFVSFEFQNNIFYVSYSNYKIELTNYIQDFYEDEDGNKSDFEQIQEYCFSYALNGAVDVNGNIDKFRELLLNALKNVLVTSIEINEEE